MEKPHVVVVPFPALGHSIPLLDFAKQLASHGLLVSCVTTAANLPRLHHQMKDAISSGLDIRIVVLPTPAIEGLPEGMESFDQVPTEQCKLIFDLALALEYPFDRWLEKEGQEERGAPVCIIHDMLLGWSMGVSERDSIPRVFFDTYGAFGLSLLISAWLSASQSVLKKEGETLVLSLDLPAPVRLEKHEIDAGLFEPFMMEVIGRLQSLNQGSGILANTFEELEDDYLQHLRNLTGKMVWSIGPVLPPNCFGGPVKVSSRGKMADISEEDLVQFLDSQSSCSVVYISFGSQTFLSKEQSKALASGLEASGQPFVWAIKVSPKMNPSASDTPIDLARRYLPERFLERTKNRGLVIWGWVPQLVILSHPSVGAFMSHCGWNSMLESVTLGVPLITWPMYADQHFNSKLAVELGIGVQFCEHRTGIPDMHRVKEALNLVFVDDKSKEIKRAAEKLKSMARKAVEYGGSSKSNLQDFVSEIQKLELARKAIAQRTYSKPQIQEDFVPLSVSKAV
ncbi:scopoletin glucosyltransferase-like [Cryptomeria japonica]|uniref:scopoletin glucosyltransferase-like n=1 Tax=Cryptomeria japonica TaxID=3369 RepID=UPI0027DA6E68|nr:scopoletin glucosyltransferase-like [Cryptomeria japonica]